MAVVDTCAVVAAVDDRLPALGKRVGVDRLNISRHLDLHRSRPGTTRTPTTNTRLGTSSSWWRCSCTWHDGSSTSSSA